MHVTKLAAVGVCRSPLRPRLRAKRGRGAALCPGMRSGPHRGYVALDARPERQRPHGRCRQLLPHQARAGLPAVGHRRHGRDACQPAAGRSGRDHLGPAEDARRATRQLGIRPDDVKYVAASHTHPDHVGNVELFPKSMLLVQKAEYEWPNAQGGPRFKPGHPVTKLEGDHDVFGDGSVTILSTPGHTPGHQSLLVKLPKTGAVLLSGDAVHFKANFEARNVPGGNTDKGQTLASMSRMSDIMGQQKAQLWINHDKEQRQTMKMSPAFYE